MKKFFVLIALTTGVNSFAVTGWTTIVSNQSNFDITLSNPSDAGSLWGLKTWDQKDLSSTLLIPAHSTRSFYTEETAQALGAGEKALTFNANYDQSSIPITYIADLDTARATDFFSQPEYATVKLGNQQYTTSPNEYNFDVGCVSVEISLSTDKQLKLDSLDYGDHGDCPANLYLKGKKYKLPPKATPVLTLPTAQKVYESGNNNYEAQLSQDFILNRNEAIRVIASIPDAPVVVSKDSQVTASIQDIQAEARSQNYPFKAYELYLQTDDNLLLYGCVDTLCTLGNILWSSGTSVGEAGASPNSHLIFQKSDGNLVVRNGSDPLWASGTDNKNAAKFALQNDGNFVIYNTSNKPIWDRISGLSSTY